MRTDSQLVRSVMEAAAFVAGEEWSDHPKCVCPVIGAFLRSWNDSLPSDEERDRLLKPLIVKVLNTRSTPEVESRRAWLVTDWLVRTCAPAWLTLVKDFESHAESLRGLPEIVTSELAREHQPTIAAAWAAAGAAAGDAAGDAAWAAAWAAAGDAAGAALQPTVTELQASALDLVDRMVKVTT